MSFSKSGETYGETMGKLLAKNTNKNQHFHIWGFSLKSLKTAIYTAFSAFYRWTPSTPFVIPSGFETIWGKACVYRCFHKLAILNGETFGKLRAFFGVFFICDSDGEWVIFFKFS